VPSFGEPATRPELPAARSLERIDALRARMARRGYDRILVDADGEPSAPLSFLTGFDPRFEEAEAWARIEARRAFMADRLGIAPHPDVLPFSNLPAYLPPFLLAPDRAMTVAS
jgi:hypothetical protein